VNLEAGLTAAYHYSGLGNRTGQSITAKGKRPTEQIENVLDITRWYNNLLQRREGDATTSYVWDTSLLFASESGEAQPYLLDDLGSPVRFAQDAYDYDEFGNPQHGIPGTTQPFGFTGYQHDAVSGTWFAQAREYNTQTGRFVSEDIYKGDIQMPMTMNPYVYCINQPLDFVDPDGLILRTLWDIATTVVAPIAKHLAKPYVDRAAPTVKKLSYDVANAILDNATNTDTTDFPDTPEDYVSKAFDRGGLISVYRGQLVINTAPLEHLTNIPFIGKAIEEQVTRSGSYGIFMFLSRKGRNDITIRHESGHHVVFQHIGRQQYNFWIARPSIMGKNNDRYFSQPWEITADIFGRVRRRYNTSDPDYVPPVTHTMTEILDGLWYLEHARHRTSHALSLLQENYQRVKP